LKKENTQTATPQDLPASGRKLLIYMLPTMMVGIVALLVVVFLAQQTISERTADAQRNAARIVAQSLATRLQSEIEARRGLLRMALIESGAVAALTSGDTEAVAEVETRLQARMPGLLRLRLLSPDVSQPDLAGIAPLGYAGLDMARRTREEPARVAVEIHQTKSDSPYLAVAVPVSRDGSNIGVLFAAWDIRFLLEQVQNSPAFAGRLALTQGDNGDYVIAHGPGKLQGEFDDGVVPVPGSIWRIAYEAAPRVEGLNWMLYGVVAGGALLFLLTTVLQWRALSRDLRADMGTMVGIREAIMRRDGGVSAVAHVADSAPAIALLGQLARDARAAASAPVAARQRIPVAATGVQSAGTQAMGVEVEELDDDPAELLTGGAAKSSLVDIPAALFRAYDIRGIVGQGLSNGFAEQLGRGVGSVVRESGGKRVAVAGDARLSSPGLAAALVRGLNAAGCDVLDIGQAPTPLLYFTMNEQPIDAGVMVTGSHNPPDYNGFKIVIGDRVLDGDDLAGLRERMLSGKFSEGNGTVEKLDMVGDYVDAVVREVQLARPLKVVVDAGNGVAGRLAIETFEALGCDVVPLFCEADGNFPNHHPDPSQPANVASLMLEVQAQQADLGLAFDGDGDRLGVVDENGGGVWSDAVLMLLAGDILGRHPGVDILYDVKSSRHLASFVLSHGGRPIMWKSGHSRMRAKMQETGALLGGEFTGHLFIKERWYGFDDAIYAAARVMELLALESRVTSEVFAELPSSPSTPEFHLVLEEGQSQDLMRTLDAHKVFDDARLVELDGLRVEFANGWGLIRSSNTTPALTFRFEAEDENALEEIKGRFRDLLGRIAPDMQAPF
jgi:phosphomannomutase/phosphoglucomutase